MNKIQPYAIGVPVRVLKSPYDTIVRGDILHVAYVKPDHLQLNAHLYFFKETGHLCLWHWEITTTESNRMNKANVWNIDLPTVSGYYLATWGPDRAVSKLYYSTSFGWSFARPVGGVNGKKIETVQAWMYLPEPYGSR